VLVLFVSYMCMNYTFYLLSNWVFLYLVEERHQSLFHSGWLTTVVQLGAALGAGLGGSLTGTLCERLGNRWGYRIVPLVAMSSAALLLLAGVSVSNPYVAVAVLALCFLAVELNEGAFWGAAMTVGRGDTMAVCGFINTGGNLGGIIALPIVGHLADLHLWHTAFLIGVGFALASAFGWLFIEVAETTPKPAAALVDTPAGAY